MDFKDYLFIETELENNFSLSYYPHTKSWGPAQWGNHNAITILGRKASEHNSNKYVDIEGVGRHSPQLAEILQKLLEQFPELSDYPIKFDGPPNETVQQTLNRVNHEDFIGTPKEWFHGTSTWHWKQMGNQGMRPRGVTGIESSYQMGAAPSNPKMIYLMDNDGNTVRFAAREAASKARKAGHKDAEAIVLKINSRFLDPNNFRPDEDSDEIRWQQSVWKMGAVAYEGEIPIEAIKPHMKLNYENNVWRLYEL